MTIAAKIIEHSRWPGRPNLVTMQLHYPRFVHAEVMTHRVFSRNASSSRAIPVARMVQDVLDDPATPVEWGSNKPGMQAGPAVENAQDARNTWLDARDAAVKHARRLADLGLHKQVVNRILEPFQHISVIVTATEWDNFFAQRCHPDADPTIRALAETMRDALEGSVPETRAAHLPYLRASERVMGLQTARMVSAARCARVSYLKHDGTEPSVVDDITLAQRLIDSKHMSPFEHQATASGVPSIFIRNFHGWMQFRAEMENRA